MVVLHNCRKVDGSTRTAVEHFKELVDAALERQHIAGELTGYYVVQLPAGFVERHPGTIPTKSPWGLDPFALEHAARSNEPTSNRSAMSRFSSQDSSPTRCAVNWSTWTITCASGAAHTGRSAVRPKTPFRRSLPSWPRTSSVSSTCCPKSANAHPVGQHRSLRLYERWLKTEAAGAASCSGRVSSQCLVSRQPDSQSRTPPTARCQMGTSRPFRDIVHVPGQDIRHRKWARTIRPLPASNAASDLNNRST